MQGLYGSRVGEALSLCKLPRRPVFVSCGQVRVSASRVFCVDRILLVVCRLSTLVVFLWSQFALAAWLTLLEPGLLSGLWFCHLAPFGVF